MSPLLRPRACKPHPASFSTSAIRESLNLFFNSRAMLRPTTPPPITRKSAVFIHVLARPSTAPCRCSINWSGAAAREKYPCTARTRYGCRQRPAPQRPAGSWALAPICLIVLVMILYLRPRPESQSYIARVPVVIAKIFLNHLPFVTEAENEVFMPVMRVKFHDMPKDRPLSNGDHRLGPELGFLAQTRAQSPTKNDDFHRLNVRFLTFGSKDNKECPGYDTNNVLKTMIWRYFSSN